SRRGRRRPRHRARPPSLLTARPGAPRQRTLPRARTPPRADPGSAFQCAPGALPATLTVMGAGKTGGAARPPLHEDAHRYLAAIVESSGDAIFGKTMDGIITSWN